MNIRDIFKASIAKLDSMVSKLDTQLGVNSNDNTITTVNTNFQNIKIENNNNNDQTIKIQTDNNTNKANENSEKEKKKPEAKNNKEEKKANKKEAAPVLTEEEKKNMETIQIFNDCDLRVGKIIELKYMEDSDKVYLLKIDVGEEEPREIGTGLRKYVKEEDLLNKNCIVFANLKPKKLGG